jgi:hypothetical protein
MARTAIAIDGFVDPRDKPEDDVMKHAAVILGLVPRIYCLTVTTNSIQLLKPAQTTSLTQVTRHVRRAVL